MEALGGYDAGGRAERGNEEATEELIRIALPVLCSPIYNRRPTGGRGYSHVSPALSATTPPSWFDDAAIFDKLLAGAHFGVQRVG